MAAELQSLCQRELLTLLRQKEHYMSKTHKLTFNCKLPHYNTFLAIFKDIEEQELHLLEIEDKLQRVERANEIKALRKELCSLRLKCTGNLPIFAIRGWHRTMMKDHSETAIPDDGSLDLKYFDIELKETSMNESLSFTTRVKGSCIRISVTASLHCNSSKETDYVFASSLYVDGLVTEGQKYISSGKSPDDYIVNVIWDSFDKLIIASTCSS